MDYDTQQNTYCHHQLVQKVFTLSHLHFYISQSQQSLKLYDPN